MLFQKFTALNPIFYVILYTLIFFIPDSAYSDNTRMSAWINIDTKQPSFNNLNINRLITDLILSSILLIPLCFWLLDFTIIAIEKVSGNNLVKEDEL